MENSIEQAKVGDVSMSKWSGGLQLAEKWLSSVEDFFTAIGGGLIVIIVILSVIEVVGRYFLGHTVPGKTEIGDMLMGSLVFCGFAICQRTRRHIRMDLFLDKFLKGRSYWLTEFFTTLLSFAVYLLITIYSAKNVIFAFQIGDATGYLWWPIWPFMMFLPIGSALLCIRFTFQLPRYLLRAIRVERKEGEETWTPSGSDL